MLTRLRESTFQKFAEVRGPAKYPPSHQAGMRVPKGGSMCANCKFLAKDKVNCIEPNFITWNGGPKIPGKIDEYCSDWWRGKV